MNKITFRTQHTEQVSQQTTATIASEFAHWLDLMGLEISPANPRDKDQTTYLLQLGKDWSYEDLARDFVQSKVDSDE